MERSGVVVVTGAALLASCTAILGDDFVIGEATTATGGASSSSGGAGSGGSASGGSGGTGGAMLCGNDMLDAGETCDGDCPIECIDPDLCTRDTLMGTATTCDVTCMHDQEILCISNDGCCPVGCHEGNDDDCNMDVLVVHTAPNSAPPLVSAIQATMVFQNVAELNVQMTAPTAADLTPYDAVLVLINASMSDPVAVGDQLADFYDGGGRIVLLNGAQCTGFYVQGRFDTGGYHVVTPGPPNPTMDTLGMILEPESPLAAGLTMLPSYNQHCAVTPVGGATVVASYATTGDPLIIRKDVGGRQRVDLNFFPVTLSDAQQLQLIITSLFYQ